MKQNKANYRGKVSGAGSEMFDFAIERYNDLLQEAEASRVPITLPLPQTAVTAKAKPATRSLRQVLASLL